MKIRTSFVSNSSSQSFNVTVFNVPVEKLFETILKFYPSKETVISALPQSAKKRIKTYDLTVEDIIRINGFNPDKMSFEEKLDIIGIVFGVRITRSEIDSESSFITAFVSMYNSVDDVPKFFKDLLMHLIYNCKLREQIKFHEFPRED